MIAIAGSLVVTGCKDKKKSDPVLSKMEMAGLSSTTYLVGDSIDWSTFKVRATYDDNSKKDLTKIEYDVQSALKADTEVVVYTEGLYSQSAVSEGVYHIEAALVSNLQTKYALGTINVGEATPDKYTLVEFFEPTMKSEFATNVAGAGTSIEAERTDRAVAKANENKFIGADTTYVVGTMNPFRYNPQIAFLNKQTGEEFDGDEIYVEKLYSVKVKVDGTYVEAPAEMYTITHDGVKFEDAAIGKTFSLKMSLKGFAEDINHVKAESTFDEFVVQKGLNIYNAKQLGALNLTHYTVEELNNGKSFADHTHGFWGGTDPVFYNEATKEHYQPDLVPVWKDFLKNEQVFTNEELVAYQDVPAVFLQNKIEVTPEDIPSSYFIKAGEFTGDVRVGYLRDALPIYFPIVETQDVEINGNFWMIDTTAIPVCACNTEGGFHPYNSSTDQIFPGHAKLFEFCGLDQENYYENQKDLANGNKAIVRNIQARGNSGVDLKTEEYEKMLALTGLIFANSAFCGAEFDNCIIKEFQIGIFADRMIGQLEEVEEGVFEQVDHTTIKKARIYDCANSGIYNYANGGVYVEQSVFNRFGGAPLLNIGEGSANRASNVKFDSSVIFNNEVTGGELYFASLGVTDDVNLIKGMDAIFENQLGNNFLYPVEDEQGHVTQVMNLVSIFMNGNGYTSASDYNFYSNTTLNYGSGNSLQAFAKSDPVTAQFEAFDSLGVGMYNGIKNANRVTFYRNAIAQAQGIEDPSVIPDAYVEAMIAKLAEGDETALYIEGAYVDYLNNTMNVDDQTAPYNGVHAPICQTEIADEFFYINPSAGAFPLANPTELMTGPLEGEYVSILFPIEDTCLGLIFRISKIA